jgi:ribosomal protein S27E
LNVAVDRPTIVTCPHCGKDVETPRVEPWLIHAGKQHAPMLVGVVCPDCEHEIRLDD